MLFDINEFAKEVHQSAVDHGFWEDDDVDRQIALIHSEWSEALQADRSGCTKREVCMELIDGVLRVLDFCAAKEFSIEGCKDEAFPFFDLICNLHYITDEILLDDCVDEKKTTSYNASRIISFVFAFVTDCGLDPYELMRQKHEYNLTRPKKHGKKY